MSQHCATTLKAFLIAICSCMAAQPLLAKECAGRSAIPMVRLLPAPPCETCAKTKAEMEELLDLERHRTEEQAKHAAEDLERSVARFLKGGGISFDAEKLSLCEAYFMKRRKEEKAIVDGAKSTFCRLRPFMTPGNQLHPVDEARPDDSYSYPSGHATYGATVGFLLAEMVPEQRAEIYSRIDDYARSRMIAGVHFRSDVEAGKLFGAAIGTTVLADPELRGEFEEAKACVRKAAGLQ
jgi:acid phosphatase (class A)